ncbi:MAG: Na+/H+ antiporter subunit E, partial [Candidatus Cloacimonadota bacterium]|nr:Na+/H+ antiporter subunit E [Candidatus Cloacimonadota bacterium]
MKSIKAIIFIFLFLGVFWILLTDTSWQEIFVGLLISLVLAIIFGNRNSVFSELRCSPRAILNMCAYLFIFIFELIKSNLDVARRVISPELPINPGIVKVKTKLKSRLGRMILANSITLTPGTLTVETDKDNFYIHWIDVSSEDIEEATQ